MRGFVSQPGRARDVTNGPKPVHARPAIFVGHNMRPVHRNTQALQPQPFSVANNAHCRNHGVKVVFLNLAADFDMRGHFAFASVKLLDHGFLHDLHALFGKLLFGKRADLGVFHRQNAIHNLDNSRLCTQRVVKARELDPDCA